MAEFWLQLWSIPVRIGPILAGLLLFAGLGVLRRITKTAYTPSYFVFFPLSLVDSDIAAYYREGPYPPDLTPTERSALQRWIVAKIVAAAAITFVILPALVGALISLFMLAHEARAFVAVVVIWQGYNAVQSTIDNAGHGASARFFIGFYALYLFVLAGGIWVSYEFVSPFVAAGDWHGLFSRIWRGAFDLILGTLLAGALGSIIAYFITDREIIRGG